MLATTTPSLRSTSIRPGTPRCEDASSSSGSRKLESTRRSSTSSRFRPGDGADMNAVAADGEIVALDQQKAEIARQRGVLEIGFAEGARRQQSDPRLVAVGAGAQAVAERLEERRHALDIHRLVEIGKGARQHQAIFQRIAGARRRLGAVVQHPPAPVGAAADIGGIEMQIAAARRFDAANRAQIFVAAGNRGRGHRAIGDQPALAIEIAQHHFEQLRALRDARGQLLPIGLVDDQRQMAERPQPVGGLAGRAIGDAGLAQMPVGGGEAPLDIGRRKRGKGIEEPAPGRAGRAVLRRYIRRECRAAAHSRASIAPSGAGPDGPCFPDCLACHSRSPEACFR